MKNILLVFALVLFCATPGKTWWDPGHMLTAMIAYLQLDEATRARLDNLTGVLQRDYPQVNHFIVTGPWPDDLKADGVHAYDTWHYTNIPYKTQELAIPVPPEVNVVWAINQCSSILSSPQSKAIEKARFLAFLVHFVSDLHQPLHSTSWYNNDQPGGNQGGNFFALTGNWRNLHALWDDGCGYLSSFNDIRPFGKAKEPLTPAQIERIQVLAKELIQKYPATSFAAVDNLDPDFWALESSKLAVTYGYKGVKSKDDAGKTLFLQPNEEPTPFYLEQGQEVARKQLALSGYRLARLIKQVLK